MMESKSSFGTFLSELRISRGYENVNEYLRQFPVTMSHVHYRHLESGNRKVSIEGSKELCDALKADPKVFYYHYLKDSLPEEFMAYFSALTESDAKASAEQTVIGALESQLLCPDDNCCNYLNEHFELMPILWLIYSQPVITIGLVEAALKEHGISMPAQQLVSEFKRFGLIQTGKSGTELSIQRAKPAISFMHHSLGKRILLSETNNTLSLYSEPAQPDLSSSVMLYSVMFVTPEDRHIILRRIQEFVAQIYSAAEDTFKNKLESEAVFFSVQLAPRPQYLAASFAQSTESEGTA